MVLGLRVVRGPDWNLGNEDGGDGHLGTVVEYNGNDAVTVVWDMGSRTSCRAGQDGKCDLRILDNASIGIRFGSSKCFECKVDGIFGMKWNCKECEGVCLCSVCYIKGRHDERHEFIRYFSPGSIGVNVPKRFISQKQKSLGIFPGAKVARGTDWSWAKQDGGAGSPGKVTGLRSYEEGIGDRNSVIVTWEKTQKTAKYRVGFEGKVDLKCMVDGEAPGYEYYKEHLPLLDGDILTHYTNTSSSIKVNDMICVGMSREDLKSAQDKHGGWTVRMNDLPGRIGKLLKFSRSGDAVVEIGMDKWILNPDALVKVYDVDIGDIVRVSDDRKFVQTVQEDHGGWVDDMDMVLGKVGKAVRITPKKDVVVAFGRKTWVFHPACLIPDPEGQIFEIDPISSGAQQSAAGLGDILGLMLAQMLLGGGGVKVVGPEDFLQAAARGDDNLIVKILKSNPKLANEVIKGTTALVLASHEGHDTVVRTLLQNNVKPNQTTDEGNTPLLAAVVGKQASTTTILLDAGASINNANLKGRTALHVASSAGEDALVKLLLDRKCDVNLQDTLGNTPLHDAIFGNHNKVVDLLVSSACVDLLKQNKRGMNALHWAAYHNNSSAVDRILGKKKDIADVKNNGGFAALHIAAVNNHIQVASHLLIKGSANVDIRAIREETPLHLAAGKCHYTMIKLLLDHTADVALQDKGGNTSLHIVLGADMSQQTLLHLLMPIPRVSQIEKVKIGCLLVQSGAKIDVRNTNGKTPIDVCSDLNVRRAIVDCAAQIKPAALASRRPTSASREKMLFSQRRNCVECGNDPAEITYEPCKHKVHCLQCTFYSDACPVCYRTIETRKDNDGNVIIEAQEPCHVQ